MASLPSLVMRQVHVAGEKMFVDYAGKKPSLVDPATGEVTDVELFVAVLGASSYTYAEATRSQRGPDWIGSHCRASAFFGGVTRAVVCDQLEPSAHRAHDHGPAQAVTTPTTGRLPCREPCSGLPCAPA